jgi:hypothetical protein
MREIKEKRLDVSLYPNELGLIKFNSEEAINLITEFPKVEFPEGRDSKVEDIHSFPAFVKYFQCKTLSENRMPNQQEFRDGYLLSNSINKNIQRLTPNQMECFRCRLNRVYPSFVRDIVLALQLNENDLLRKHGVEVSWSTKLDLRGIDILLTHQGNYYGLNCYVDTPYAKKYLEEKKLRNPDFENVHYIDMKLSTKIKLKPSDIDIYDDLAMETIKHKVGIS